MATISLTRDVTGGFGTTIAWPSMANGDVGQAWDTQDYPDLSIHLIGTLGVGGTLVIQGSNEVTPSGSNWQTLNDPQANPLSFTVLKIEQVMENVRWIRPIVTAGDGTTSLTPTLYAGRRR